MNLIRPDRPLDSVAQVIDALGGIPAVRVLTASSPQQVSNWRRNGTFPPETFLQFWTALRRKRLRARAALWRMREPIQ